jgi:ABC-type multidrug transport system fused ATPase/permease subunit
MRDQKFMRKVQERWYVSTFGRAFQVLTRKDQRKLVGVVFLQVCIGTLDLFGVMAIGLLGALSVSGLQSQLPGNRVTAALNFLQISTISFQNQVLFLGIGAVILLVGRTILSILFTRHILFFLSNRGAQISATLVSRLLSQSLIAIQSRTSQETLFAVTRGVEYVTLQILAPAIVLVSDITLLIVMAIGLFTIDPLTAVGTFLVFLTIGYVLYRFMHVKAGALGAKSSELNIVSNEKIVEVFSSYRESVVRNRRDYYAREIGTYRFALARTAAEMNFLPYVSKYVIETAVILGALFIAAAQFLIQDAVHSVATLAIFLAAGTRIAPAVLRIQQGSVLIRGSLGQAEPTLRLIEDLGSAPVIAEIEDKVDVLHEGFSSEIHIESVTLNYPGKNTSAISNVSLHVPPGKSVAFVGPSGAGKTTIIDILLGVLPPDQGYVQISSVPPQHAVVKWPGAIAYVPQDVVIAAGTIRENVALGYPLSEATDELVMSALRVAQLERFIENLPEGMDTQVGERGTKISGGQRQRLGIARAMFTRPHLLVLDEATSSLDGETEAGISRAIHGLRGSTTVVMIAHRLSTIRDADIVVYMDKGKVIATGTFNEVRTAVSDFDHQAKLMGL